MATKDIEQWAERENLTPETLRVLKEEGFDSLGTLSELTSADIDAYFTNTNLMKKQQCTRLKKAVERLNMERSQVQADSGHVASSAGQQRGSWQSEDVRGHAEDMKLVLPSREKSVTEVVCQNEDTIPFQEVRMRFETVPAREQRVQPTERPTYSAQDETKFFFPEELQFLLVGKTGVGKSATGNTILGNNNFGTSVGFSSETSKCEINRGVVSGLKVQITDSPGLFDTSVRDDNIAQMIAQAVACLHPGPHAFLFVVKIGRFTREEEGTYKRLIAIFDEEVTKYMVIVFTGGDNLKSAGQTIGDIISTATPELKGILNACGGRYVVFDNMAADKKPQINSLFQIVVKMVNENINKRYTCPQYISIGEKMEEEIQKRMIEVEKREIKNKEYIKQLEIKNKVLEEEAKKAKDEFEMRTIQRHNEFKEQEKIINGKMKEINDKLEQNIFTVKEKEKEMKKLVKDKEDLEKNIKKKQEEDAKKMEAEEKKRKETADKAMEEMKKSLQKMEQAREEEIRKLKDRIARNEERGLLDRMVEGFVNTLTSFGSTVSGWFSSK